MDYKRLKGGEKNIKSGTRWTKEEILEVYFLYERLGGVGLHEHNPEIQNLAKKLGRTVRSTEAQTLMFRNLEKSGDYSHGNMNKLTREVWLEYRVNDIDSSNNEVVSEKEESDEFAKVKTYFDWNLELFQHFFNSDKINQEILCFPVHMTLFDEVSQHSHTREDFIYSIKQRIGVFNFRSELERLYRNSLPQQHNGRTIRKKVPDYFGFLIFLIHALSDQDSDEFISSNVYGRINLYGKGVFGNKWADIDSAFARDILEKIWADLEDWTVNYKGKSLGYFIRRSPENQQRKYVSRIERHSLLNSDQFDQIIDVLIDQGIPAGQILDVNKWIQLLEDNGHTIRRSDLLIEYLQDDSELQNSILNFLNEYLIEHYTVESIASEHGTRRNPPKPLKLCIETIPNWNGEEILDYCFRVNSEEIEYDQIKDGENTVIVDHEWGSLSKSIFLNKSISESFIIESEEQRYAFHSRPHWLVRNHELNSWIETSYPSNGVSFLLVSDAETEEKLKVKEIGGYSVFPIHETDKVAFHFKSLNSEDFDEVYALYNPYKRIEGKITLESQFTCDRRTVIFKDFPNRFRYVGPQSSPLLELVSLDSNFKVELVFDESSEAFIIPKLSSDPGKFQIIERKSSVKTHYNLKYGNLHRAPENIQKVFVKDHEGSNISRDLKGIYDVPEHFARDLNVVKFNDWHSKLFKLFNERRPGPPIEEGGTYNVEHFGNNFLNFLALNGSITTYEFPKMIKTMFPNVSPGMCKRVLEYWKDLGYINFQTYGERIKVSPTGLFFVESRGGLMAFISGYRNNTLLSSLENECKNLGIKIKYEDHSVKHNELFPQKICLYDEKGDIDKFEKLAERLEVPYWNEIRNAFNHNYVVYQLACFYTQRSVEEFLMNHANRLPYQQDHRRKLIFDSSNLKWKESTELIDDVPNGSLVRYEGFKDRSVFHVFKADDKAMLIDDLGIGIFAALKETILLAKLGSSENKWNLLVPLYVRLPFWIERGLIMIHARIPELLFIEGKPFRVYEDVDKRICDVIGAKLGQEIKLIEND